MNTRLQNQLREHGFGGSHVCITFHYDDVIIVKINEKTRRGFQLDVFQLQWFTNVFELGSFRFLKHYDCFMPKFHKHSFLYCKCWAFLVHYACFMWQFVEFFHAQASQTLIFVLQMLGILDSIFSMYIFYSCIKVQWYVIFPPTLSICLCTSIIKNVTNVVLITIQF